MKKVNRWVLIGVGAVAAVTMALSATGAMATPGDLADLVRRMGIQERGTSAMQSQIARMARQISDLQTQVSQLRAGTAKQEVWHGYYMQGSRVGWTIIVDNNGNDFTGTSVEFTGAGELDATISGHWDGDHVTWVKHYTTIQSEDITYDGHVGSGGDITGTWTTSFGSDAFAMSR